MRPIRVLPVLGLVLLAISFEVGATHHEEDAKAAEAAKPWDQQAVSELATTFSREANDAYSAIYAQGETGSGSRREFARFKDKARRIQREARHLRAEVEGGKGHDDTLAVVEHLMLEVRDLRVIGRRINIQQMALDKISAAGASLREIVAYYDPAMFEAGAQAPLMDSES